MFIYSAFQLILSSIGYSVLMYFDCKIAMVAYLASLRMIIRQGGREGRISMKSEEN